MNRCSLIFLLLAAAGCYGEDSYILPSTVVPSLYVLNLNIDPNADTFKGGVSITFKPEKGSNQVSLHASKDYLDITNTNQEGTVKAGRAAAADDCKVLHWNETTEIVTLNCTKKFEKNKDNVLTIDFTGKYADQSHGLFKGNYEDDVIVATQFEATYARRVFPCFDEPEFKAEFEVTITHPKEYSVLSNTLVAEETSETQVKFTKTPTMSTYLIAFTVSKFISNNVTVDKNEPEFHVYSRPSLVDNTALALKYGPKLISALESWTGLQYKDLGNAKMDMIALPEKFGGAMENWGLITFSEIALLDDGDLTSADQKQSVISVMAHELSHQWFGDFVTMDWWSNTWLNEGFANFFENIAPDMVDDKDLKMELTSQFVTDIMYQALEADAYPSSPISSKKEDVKTQDEISGKFDGITYNKGASVLRMIQSILGEDAFKVAIQSYLKANKQSNGTPEKLFEKLQEAYKGEGKLIEKLDSYIFKSGYPVLNVVLKNSTTVEITQKKFALMSDKDDEATVWQVPLSYTTSSKANFDVKISQWLGNETLSLTIKEDEWIILNLQRTGFYRVNYDTTLWNRIIKELKSNMTNIHVLNRAGLVNDAFSLARIGAVEYDLVFELAEYLRDETEYYPWSSYFNGMDYLSYQLDSDSLVLLEDATLTWVQQAFPNFTNSAEGISHVNILKNRLINEWKCSLGDKDCLKYVEDSMAPLLNGSKANLANNNDRYLVYCNSLIRNSKPDQVYDYLMKRLNNTKSAYERVEILEALSCSAGDLQDRLFDEILSNTTIIHKNEVNTIFKSLLAEGETMAIIMFLMENAQAVVDNFEGYVSIPTLVNQLSKEINDDNHLQMTLSMNKDIIDDEEELAKTSHSYVQVNTNWKKSYGSKIKKLLQKLTGNTGTIITPTSIVSLLCMSFSVLLLRPIFD